MSKWIDLIGTSLSKISIGFSGVVLKNNSGNLSVRNAADTADSSLTTSQVNVSGNDVVLNSAATGTGSSYTVTLRRPSTGMSSNIVHVLPSGIGSAGQYLSTDGSGNWLWAASNIPNNIVETVEALITNSSSSTVAISTPLPANAEVTLIRVIVTTAFDGSPTVALGISGNTSKYLATTQSLLTSATTYEVSPGLVPNSSAENLQITFSSGSSTTGAARIQLFYVIPSN